jgi:hypothetical protein
MDDFLPRPQFSKSNPYWPKPIQIGRFFVCNPNATDYLNASHWEANAPSWEWGFEMCGGKLTFEIQAIRGNWGVHVLRWRKDFEDWWREYGRKAQLSQTDSQGSSIRASVETPARTLPNLSALHS